MLLFISLAFGIIILASIYLIHQMFEMILLDAHCRRLEHPKLWAWFSIGGQHGEGLLLYLLKRKNNPPAHLSDSDFLILQDRKKKAKIAVIFQVIGCLIFLFAIFFLS